MNWISRYGSGTKVRQAVTNAVKRSKVDESQETGQQRFLTKRSL
jgi:hypothetical protein